MAILIGSWVSIILYLVVWVYELVIFRKHRVLPLGWSRLVLVAALLCHVSVMGYRLMTLGRDEAFLTADLLAWISWITAFSLFVFRHRLQKEIKSNLLLPFSILLMIISTLLIHHTIPAMQPFVTASVLDQIILVIHIATLMAGHVLFGLACFSSMLFLYQEHRLKTKMVTLTSHRFPSLGLLDRVSSQSMSLGFFFFTLGLVLGILLTGNLLRSLSLPIRLAVPLVVWVVYAVFMFESSFNTVQRKRTAIWSIMGFVLVMMSFMVELYYLRQ